MATENNINSGTSSGEHQGEDQDQDTQLDPVLVATLPSGIGVYKCPFIDMWGSNLAYAVLTHRSKPR